MGFDYKAYKQQYEKDNYKQVKFVLKKDEFKIFKEKLDANNIEISEFLKKCVKNIEEIIKSY